MPVELPFIPIELLGDTPPVALANHTGSEPNRIFDGVCDARGWDPIPAYLGLGFFPRCAGIFPMPFGVMASSDTSGGLGAGLSTRAFPGTYPGMSCQEPGGGGSSPASSSSLLFYTLFAPHQTRTMSGP
jgi:hypothetical protein